MSSDPNRSVKQMLWDFNAQRMLAKVVKGHRAPPTSEELEQQQRLSGAHCASGRLNSDHCVSGRIWLWWRG